MPDGGGQGGGGHATAPLARNGFVLALGPEHERAADCAHKVHEACRRGEGAFLYALHEGIRCLFDPQWIESAGPDVRLFGCAYAARRRGLVPVAGGAIFGGLGLLGDVIAGCETCHSVTGEIPASGSRPPVGGAAPRVIVALQSDAVGSDRPSEGLRVAAGLAGRDDLKVTVVMEEPAALLWQDPRGVAGADAGPPIDELWAVCARHGAELVWAGPHTGCPAKTEWRTGCLETCAADEALRCILRW